MGHALSILIPVVAFASVSAIVLRKLGPKGPPIEPVRRHPVQYIRMRAPTPDPPAEVAPFDSPVEVALPDPPVELAPSPTGAEPLAPTPDPPVELALSPTGTESMQWDDRYDCPSDDGWTVVCGMGNPLEQFLPKGEKFAGRFHIGVVGAQGTGKTSLCGMFRAVIAHFRALGEDAVSSVVTDQVLIDAYREHLWDPTREVPMVENDHRDPTPWAMDNLVLWDIAGGGVRGMASEDYVEANGIAFMSCVLVLVGLFDTDVTDTVISALREKGVPFVLVQTHTDQYLRKTFKSEGDQWVIAGGSAGEMVQAGKFDADQVLRDRRAYLRTTYALGERDQVMCVNANPKIDDAVEFALGCDRHVDKLERDTYDLADCIVYALHAASEAHSE